MRFVIAALLVFVVMMINLNSVSEHTAGTSLRDKTRNENQMVLPDRAADSDPGFSIYMAKAAFNEAHAAFPPAQERAKEEQAAVADAPIEQPKADFCDARCQRSPRSKQLRSVIGIISLDHAIFRKISIEHRNFFRCRIAP